MKENFENYLTRHSHLTERERKSILNCFDFLKLKKNAYWIKKGEICRHLAFVNSGILRIINEEEDKDNTVQLIFKDSFTTSLTSFAYQIPSIWGIQSITDSELLIIERENHFSLVNRYKNWLEIDNLQLLLAYTDLENRFFSQFHLSAKERFSKLFSEKPEIFNQVPLKYIASVLGIAPETLSRLRKKHIR